MQEVCINFFKSFPGSKLNECHGCHCKFIIPKSAVTIASLFSKIQENMNLWHIEEYSVSQSSLEEVFLSMAKNQKEEVSDQN